MAKKSQLQNKPNSSNTSVRGEDPDSSELDRLIQRVKSMLQEDRAQEALDLVNRSKLSSSWITNARGVCLLRLGSFEQAASMFRGLIQCGISIKSDAPAVFKSNFAVALLAADNLSGCLSALHDAQDEEAPTIKRLRSAIQAWRQGLSWWKKLQWYLGEYPAGRVPLDFPLGDLE